MASWLGPRRMVAPDGRCHSPTGAARYGWRSLARAVSRTTTGAGPRYNRGMMKPLVGIIMGSQSDWETLRAAAETLAKLSIPHEVRIVSAHLTPDLLFEDASSARQRG